VTVLISSGAGDNALIGRIYELALARLQLAELLQQL